MGVGVLTGSDHRLRDVGDDRGVIVMRRQRRRSERPIGMIGCTAKNLYAVRLQDVCVRRDVLIRQHTDQQHDPRISP